MSKLVHLSPFLFLLLVTLFPFSLANIGSAARYSPPYLPTACSGNDPSPFPSSNLFAAAGEGLWDNGAACGRTYSVICISASSPTICKPSNTIQVKIVDRAETAVSRPSANGATIVLSDTAFGQITNSPASIVNIEYKES